MKLARDGWRAAARVIVACGALALGCGSSGSANADGSGSDSTVAPRVTGTLTLPAAASGKPWSVKLFTMDGRTTVTPTAETSGTTGSGTTIDYAIATVPAGTYFVLGFVDVDMSGGTSSTPGDFAGWYGHNGDGNPPAQANAVVTASGTAVFSFTLVQR